MSVERVGNGPVAIDRDQVHAMDAGFEEHAEAVAWAARSFRFASEVPRVERSYGGEGSLSPTG